VSRRNRCITVWANAVIPGLREAQNPESSFWLGAADRLDSGSRPLRGRVRNDGRWRSPLRGVRSHPPRRSSMAVIPGLREAQNPESSFWLGAADRLDSGSRLLRGHVRNDDSLLSVR
jgi:hypothetical protein